MNRLTPLDNLPHTFKNEVMVLNLLGDQEMRMKKIQRGIKHRVEFFTWISWLPSKYVHFLIFESVRKIVERGQSIHTSSETMKKNEK